MILAAHQPCYLPDFSFFQKMCKAQVFVLADDLQYSANGSTNRTRIKTAHGAEWLTVPVRTKGRRHQSISQVEVDSCQNWRTGHWRTLVVNYKYAAYFDQFSEFFEELYSRSWRKLVDLNLEIIRYFIQTLNIETELLMSSDLEITATGRDWPIEVLEKTRCDCYLADQGFESYLNANAFSGAGLSLAFFSSLCPNYHQQFGDFLSGLSILDLLFNEGEFSRDIVENTD